MKRHGFFRTEVQKERRAGDLLFNPMNGLIIVFQGPAYSEIFSEIRDFGKEQAKYPILKEVITEALKGGSLFIHFAILDYFIGINELTGVYEVHFDRTTVEEKGIPLRDVFESILYCDWPDNRKKKV